MKHIELVETVSTNTWVAAHADSLYIRGENSVMALPEPVMVRAYRQTAGRGQRGNSWESAPGQNLTASVLLQPIGVLPREQFAVSEAVALAVCDMVRELAPETDVKVKWPNDIYIGDRKVSGILIEHSIYGSEIRRTIAGIGLNINQRTFVSDAPNPVSIWQVTDRVNEVAEVAQRLGELLERRIAQTPTTSGRQELHEEFLNTLWRGDGGFWPFIDTVSGDQFAAKIEGVERDGYLCLVKTTGELLKYAFKEVQFVVKC